MQTILKITIQNLNLGSGRPKVYSTAVLDRPALLPSNVDLSDGERKFAGKVVVEESELVEQD